MWSVPEDGSAEVGAFSERGGGKQEPCSCREFIAMEFGESVFLSSSIGPRARDSNW